MIKKLLKNVLISITALFLIIYFCVQVKNIFIDAMETEYATLATFDDTVEIKCYIVRDETCVTTDKGGTYNYVISEGEKLSSGQTITNVYSTDSAYRVQEQIQEINSKIDVLENSSVEHNYFTLNVSKIDENISEILTKYRNHVLSGEYSLAQQQKNDLLITLNKRYLVVNALTGFDKTITQYENEKSTLMSGASQSQGSVQASSSGYFYSNVDGYENILTPQLLFSGTVDEIISALEGPPEAISHDTVGKIVSDFEWYTVCVVDKELSMRFVSDKYYEIAYPYSVGTVVKSELVNKIVQSDSDKVILVFRSSDNVDSFNFMRNQVVEIKFESFSGLRIKKEALRIVDGEEGVYILDGNTVKFKRASKIYENDGYYIISATDPEYGEDNAFPYLKMYDAVINNGKELYNGKTIG